ncbi:hypothetical protein T11_11143 [Trichinella zimbabwensis]|uniref:Uncharacterized protein n=1 Tax=Trichinella zimbabwensis TaxID=268475 RepID=A0A0V1I7L4_9BILA|nr:hypothetical protein T11_11143 [Trichinella zimbabwensis]
MKPKRKAKKKCEAKEEEEEDKIPFGIEKFVFILQIFNVLDNRHHRTLKSETPNSLPAMSGWLADGRCQLSKTSSQLRRQWLVFNFVDRLLVDFSRRNPKFPTPPNARFTWSISVSKQTLVSKSNHSQQANCLCPTFPFAYDTLYISIPLNNLQIQLEDHIFVSPNQT